MRRHRTPAAHVSAALRAGGVALCLVGVSGAAAAQVLPSPSAPPQARTVTVQAPSGWLGISIDATATVTGRGSVETSSTTLRVARTFEGGPAAVAGVQAGDRIIEVNGAAATLELFDRVARRLAPGDPVALTVERRGSPVRLSLVAAARPGVGELVPRTLQTELDSARRIFVARLEESLHELREGLGEEVLARVAPEMARVQAERVVPRFEVHVEEGDSIEIVGFRLAEDDATLHIEGRRVLGDVPAGAQVRLGRVSSPDPDRVEVTVRPLAPYLYGADRVAGARFVPLGASMRSYFGVAEGILTAEVLPGTPAAQAGLRAGDVVVGVGETSIASLDGLRRSLADAGVSRTLRIVRRGRSMELELGR